MSNRLTIKGQVTVPKNIRDFLELSMGNSAIEFSIEPDGSVKIKKAEAGEKAPARTTEREVNNSSRSVSHCDRVLGMLSGYFV